MWLEFRRVLFRSMCGGEPAPGGYVTSTKVISRCGSPGRLCFITSRRVEPFPAAAGCAAARPGNDAATVMANEMREAELKPRLVTADSFLVLVPITISFGCAVPKGR